jgi:hypothetical protein
MKFFDQGLKGRLKIVLPAINRVAKISKKIDQIPEKINLIMKSCWGRVFAIGIRLRASQMHGGTITVDSKIKTY